METEWELYNIDEDPSQSVDLAERYPEKVKELETLFWEETEKYNVYQVGEAFWAEPCSLNRIRRLRRRDIVQIFQGVSDGFI